MTGQDIITGAFVDMGETMPGETPSDDDLNNGLVVLNLLLDSLSIRRLGIFGWQLQTFALTAGNGGPGTPYTLGAGGTFSGTRPVMIKAATIILTFSNINGTAIVQTLRFPIPVLPVDAWSAIAQKDLQALMPERLFNDGAFPLSNIYFHPVPKISGVASVELSSWLALTQLGSLSTTFAMPPGYAMAIRKLLAVNLCSTYGRTPPQDLVALANDYEQNLGSLNRPPVPGAMEEALLAQLPQPAATPAPAQK